VGTRWLNAVVRLRSKIYEEYRCDDTDNVAPKDIGLETSNKSEEFNDATVYRNATKSLWGKKIGWVVPPNALRRNGPEYAAAFDYIQSIKSDLTESLIQVRDLAERGPLATVGDPLANT